MSPVQAGASREIARLLGTSRQALYDIPADEIEAMPTLAPVESRLASKS